MVDNIKVRDIFDSKKKLGPVFITSTSAEKNGTQSTILVTEVKMVHSTFKELVFTNCYELAA